MLGGAIVQWAETGFVELTVVEAVPPTLVRAIIDAVVDYFQESA